MAEPIVRRVRHENARRRELVVTEKRLLAPNYLSIRFHCDDFEDFASASWDDHIKVFLAGEGSAGGKPPMRDYTPRSFDPATGEFVIEFALHDDPGPATSWARDCYVGDRLAIGGPRGSAIVPADCDWYWLCGDETAIPAISRCLEEQPDSRIEVILAVGGPGEEVPLPQSPSHNVSWVYRPPEQATDPGRLQTALARLVLPDGDGFVWIAAEGSVAKVLREDVLALGHPPTRLKARGYWVAGKADETASFD